MQGPGGALVDVAGSFREFVRLDRKRAAQGLTHTELRRWMALKRRLTQAFSPGLSDWRADQRSSLRVPARLAVSFHDLGELRACLMTNLSRGGVFVATDDPLELGTRLELRLTVEETGKQIEVPAEVVSQNVGPDLRPDQRGMGLRFTELDAEAARQIAELYERALERAAETLADRS